VSRIEVAGAAAAVAHLDVSPLDADLDPYLLHPALLDGALQALLGLLADRQHQVEGVSFLPWRFGRVRLLAPFGRVPRRAQLRLTRIGVRSISAEIALFDNAGDLVAELADCWFRRVELTRRATADERALRVDLVPSPLIEPGISPVSDRCGAILSRLAAPVSQTGRGTNKPVAGRSDRLGRAPINARIVDPDAFSQSKNSPSPGSSHRPPADLPDPCVLERPGAAAEGRVGMVEASADLPDARGSWRLLLADAPTSWLSSP
jgi:hypothetical protein